jgi:hypothetical protein
MTPVLVPVISFLATTVLAQSCIVHSDIRSRYTPECSKHCCDQILGLHDRHRLVLGRIIYGSENSVARRTSSCSESRRSLPFSLASDVPLTCGLHSGLFIHQPIGYHARSGVLSWEPRS